MAQRTVVGIDIGTYQIRVVVAGSPTGAGRQPVILGTGFAASRGLRHGYIINGADLTKSLRQAIAQAEKSSGIRIQSAYLSVGGVGLDEARSRGEVAVSRPDQVVTDLDMASAVDESERRLSQKLINRKILHVIPVTYYLDGTPVLGRAQGMKGAKLSVETLFITTLEQHLQDLITAVEDLGISVTDVMASPLAASFVTLTKAQKMAGCVLANIGAETISIVVFENAIPISLKVFPVGSTDITNDIALNLKISLEDAEQLKRGAIVGGSYPKKQLEDIIAGKLADMFTLVESHLTKIGKNGMLPAGIIITGGGSGIASAADIARAALKLPSKRGTLIGPDDMKIKDSSWAVAYGLTIWGLSTEEESFGISLAKQAGTSILAWLRQFLP